MKKFVIFSILLLAAGCNRSVVQQPPENKPNSDVGQARPDEMATYANPKYNFVIKYSPEFQLQTPTKDNSDWSNALAGNGLRVATIYTDQSYQPGTNFVEAKLDIGVSTDKSILGKCLQPGEGEKSAGKETINGTTFYKFTSIGAAAGNRYDTTAYRGVFLDRCYSLEEIIHYGNIQNYDPSLNVKEFDEGKVLNALETMTHTFSLH